MTKEILRSIPGSRFSTVAREWDGATVVIIGGGPSLTQEQVELARSARESGGVKVIAVNDAYLWCDWADVLYAADASWHEWHRQGTPKPKIGLTAVQVRERFADFKGQKCSIESQAANIKDDRTHILRNANGTMHGTGLSFDPGALVTGRNSGFQSLQVAILAGAKKVILIGFDGRPTTDGRTHWSGGHPLPTPSDAYMHYRKSFTDAAGAIKAAGVAVWNCSPDSAIDAFEMEDLADCLQSTAT